METIDVAMTAWPNHPKRLAYFEDTLASLHRNLTATGYELRFYCSAESEHDPRAQWCGEALVAICEEHGIELAWRSKPANLGANMNAAMAMGCGEFVYLQQDDWRLEYPLDIGPGADLLATDERVDMVRYSWPGHPDMSPTFYPDKDGWRKIDVNGKWPYGDDPHLRRRSFMDKFRWYLEGGQHGSASNDLMKAMRREKAYIVAADRSYYRHFGWVSANIIDHRGGNKRRYEE